MASVIHLTADGFGLDTSCHGHDFGLSHHLADGCQLGATPDHTAVPPTPTDGGTHHTHATGDVPFGKYVNYPSGYSYEFDANGKYTGNWSS